MILRVRLLAVEDDETLTKSWQDAIELQNADDLEIEIIGTFVKSYGEAIQNLSEKTFDAAVVDLRLKVLDAGGHHNQQGRDVVTAVALNEAIPTVIYTGQPDEAGSFPDAPMVTVIDKGEPFTTVLDWLRSKAELIRQMQAVNATVKTDMAKVFQTSIWPRWENWIGGPTNPNTSVLHEAITRHFVSHLHAGLLNISGEAHPEEWYFVPPVRSASLSTGDMFTGPEGKVEILVTPRCDLENGKGDDTLQLVVCEDAAEDWDTLLGDMKSPDVKIVDKAKNKYGSFLKHRTMPRLHFLPRMKMLDGTNAGPWFIRFDKIRSVARTPFEIDGLKAKRFATLTPEFLPSLVERLGTFFSRIGTPNHSKP